MTSLAREVLAQHSKSFSLAGRLLPKESYDDAAVLYAYCRRADDAIDLGSEVGKEELISKLREELASIYAGEPQSDPLYSAFQKLVKRRAIPIGYPAALLDGLETDLGPVRIRTLAELMSYAYRVAGVVGLMMCHVLRVTDPRALRHAADLGIAMQITNVCRDVLEDWERGRLYIPAEVLADEPALKLAPGEAFPNSRREDMARAVRHLLGLAETYYRSADLGLWALSPRSAFAVRAARYIYSAIGTELARQDYDPLEGRVVVSRTQKLLLVARAGIEELAARLLKGWRNLWATEPLAWTFDPAPRVSEHWRSR